MGKLFLKNSKVSIKPDTNGGSTTLSLLEQIEKIIFMAEGSSLSNKFFEDAEEYLNNVSKKLKINKIQAVIFSLILNNIDQTDIYLYDIAKHLKCTKFRLMQHMNEIDSLIAKKYIKKSNYGNKSCDSYKVPNEVVKSILNGKKYTPEKRMNLDNNQIINCIFEDIQSLQAKEIDIKIFLTEIITLLKDNKHLNFSVKLLSLKNRLYNELDFVLLMAFCNLFINEGDDCIGEHNYQDLFRRADFFNLKRSLKYNNNALIKLGIIEHVNDQGFEDTEYHKFTENAKEDLFAEFDIKINTTIKDRKKDVIYADSIIFKELYYNESESAQLEQLTSILKIENFKTVQDRLKENGLRSGFACLFYGLPGVGKTESVYQIAKITNRDIMTVNISECKSMWFGESEKKIKQLFVNYKKIAEKSKITPILLFNEADAVLSKRTEISSSRTAQTENSLQNIILEEMESLNGIMIATTNLIDNLDKAFERRFLYKIKFETPMMDAKKNIWKSMISGLNDENALKLANSYNFSGGQIENISRKYIVDKVILGKEAELTDLIKYCDSELLQNNSNRTKIGYIC